MPALTIGGFYIKSYEFTRSWGIEPASSSGVGVVNGGGSPSIGQGDSVVYSFFGISFYGIVSSVERLRTFQDGDEWAFSIVDNRIRLRWGIVFGQWNIEEDSVDRGGGLGRGRKFKHIPPANWASQRPVYTDTPKTANQILDEAFSGAVGGYNFSKDYHSSQSKPVMNVDANSGTSLAALVSQVADAQGLQVTLDGLSTLRFGRRGEDTLSIPSGSHVERDGEAMSSEPTRVRVVGGRTLVQVNDVPFEKDWRPAWEDFLSEPAWLDEVDRVEGPFSGTTSGQAELAARAREITVRQYVAISGLGAADFTDTRNWGRISRMDMPAWDYLNKIVFRSYRVQESANLFGIPIRELELHDQLLCAAEISGEHTVYRQDPVEYYPQSSGYVIVKGQPLDLVNVEQTVALVSARTTNLRTAWSEISDFSLDPASHSIRFATPVFLDGDPASDQSILSFRNLEIPGIAEDSPYRQIVVPNPDYLITAAEVKASLVFRLGVFHKDFGTGNRWSVHQVSAVAEHLLYGYSGFAGSNSASYDGDLGTPEGPVSGLLEILYEDGSTAAEQAAEQSAGLIVRSGSETSGQYTRYGAAGTALNGQIDRTSIRITREGGIVETVEFSKPRPTRGFISSRDISERVKVEELYDGFEQLASEVRQLRGIARLDRMRSANEKARTPSHSSMPDVFRKPLGSADTDVRTLPAPNSQYPDRGEDGGGWKAGDIVWLDDKGKPSRGGETFGGVVVMDATNTSSKFITVSVAGTVPVWVVPGTASGPVMANPGDWKGSSSGDYPIGMLGHSDPVPGTGAATLALVRLGGGAGKADPCPFGEIITIPDSNPVEKGIRGGIIYCGDQNWNMDPELLNLATDGVWLVSIPVSCTANTDDDDEILLPGIETGTRPAGGWTKTVWVLGTDYPENTPPALPLGVGIIHVPIGKLTIDEGVAKLEAAGCGNIEISHCAGTLFHDRV